MLSRQKTVLAHYVLQSYYFKPQKSCFSRKNNLFYFILLPKINKKKAKANFSGCIYNHRTTKTNQKYPSVNL